jgi:hypothetical protein
MAGSEALHADGRGLATASGEGQGYFTKEDVRL